MASNLTGQFPLLIISLLVALHASPVAGAEVSRLNAKAATLFASGNFRQAAETWEKAAINPVAPDDVGAVIDSAAAGHGAGSPAALALEGFPEQILWAWERPEDLRFLPPGSVGVAFLAKTISLKKGLFSVRPRLQPLLTAPGTPLMAVVRIESTRPGPAAPVAALALEIVATTHRKQIRALQIDFDARRSERPFYRELLGEVRRQLPAEIPLSITALASWCLGDNWLDTLPVEEAVPMLFRLGPERQAVLARVSGSGFSSAICSTSFGTSLDEPIAATLPPADRRYYFSPRPWTQQSVKALP